MSNSKRELGTIEYIFVGKEPDHDILTCNIGIRFKGSYQSFGNLCLNKDEFGNDYLKSFVDDICNIFNVIDYNDLVGKECYALRCFEGCNESIEGIETIDGKRFTITSWRRKHFKGIENLFLSKVKRIKSEIDSHYRRIDELESKLESIKYDYTDWDK